MRLFPIRPNVFLAAVLTVLALAAPVPAATGPVEVRLPAAVRLDADRITLGRIARIATPDDALARRLAPLAIGKAPPPGQRRRLDRRYLLLRLKQAGLAEEQVRFSGADAVTVTRASQTVTRERMARVAADWVLSHHPFDPQQVRVTDVQIAGDIDLPAGEVTLDVDPGQPVDFLRPVRLNLEIRVDGKPVRRVPALVSLAVSAPVVVTSRPLARYQTVTEEDIVVQMHDLADLPGGVISDPAKVLGQRMRRSVGTYTPLRPDLVEVPPVVRRGDVVTMVVESGGLRVTALGEVRSLGRPGERIGVVNLGSGKIVQARVLNARTVSVEF